jgi:hypothetical protein
VGSGPPCVAPACLIPVSNQKSFFAFIILNTLEAIRYPADNVCETDWLYSGLPFILKAHPFHIREQALMQGAGVKNSLS